MPVTIVVGGQFGSEGKGKVAHHFAEQTGARAVVRVGGSNSGHTACDGQGRRRILRQLPTAALLPDVTCVLAAGSYIDPAILLQEIADVDLAPERLLIDPNAVVISETDRAAEAEGDLGAQIGSTCSGTGAAVAKRITRRSAGDLAGASPELQPYVGDVHGLLREVVSDGDRLIVEGTQGFGLSVLHSPYFPHVTSRDTTAAGALSEVGLSPLDVDDIVLVLRAHPIRVSGNSGPFGSEETDWRTIEKEGGHSEPLAEYTSVTGRLRRVARFEPAIVRRAISANQPTVVVMNHVDYVDAQAGVTGEMTLKTHRFIHSASHAIGHRIDYVGLGPAALLEANAATMAA